MLFICNKMHEVYHVILISANRWLCGSSQLKLLSWRIGFTLRPSIGFPLCWEPIRKPIMSGVSFCLTTVVCQPVGSKCLLVTLKYLATLNTKLPKAFLQQGNNVFVSTLHSNQPWGSVLHPWTPRYDMWLSYEKYLYLNQYTCTQAAIAIKSPSFNLFELMFFLNEHQQKRQDR